MATPPLLCDLVTAAGPSGYEQAPARVWRAAADALASADGDVLGSQVARVPGTAGGPLLAIFGHIDEIGMIVTHVSDQGFLHFTGVGGWDPQILVGQRVEVHTRTGPVPGVIGQEADPPPARGRPQEGRGDPRPPHRRRRPRRR